MKTWQASFLHHQNKAARQGKYFPPGGFVFYFNLHFIA